MTAIFQHSRNVLCYLGPGGKRSAEAFDMLQILARWWHEATVNMSFPPRLGAATVQELENIRSLLHAHDFSDLNLQDSAKWQEVEELFSASYFKSAQALPDVRHLPLICPLNTVSASFRENASNADCFPQILLGQNTMIWSGNRSLSWQDFLAASHTYLFLATKRHEQLPVHLQEALEIFEPIETAARRHREGQELELLPMMLSTRHSAASAADPRECIFALLPIIGHAVRTNRPNGQRQPLPVLDYAKGASEVFQEAAKFIIEERQDFALWWSEAPPSGRGIQGMPSWVPDWSTLQPRNHAGITPDCGLRTWADNVPSAKRIFVDEASALHVQAHHFDRIEYTSAIFTEENYRSILLQAWESCYPYAKPGQDIQNSAEDPFMQTCVRALVLDQDLRTPYDVDGKQRPLEALWQSLYSLLAEECILRAVRTSRPGVDPSQMTREEVQEMQETNEDCKKYSPYVGRSTEFAELFLNNSLGRRFFKTEKAMLGMTAIETPAANTTFASGVAADKLVPSTMDEQFRDPMARTMLEGFQRFLATKDPKAAEALSKSMTGRLPGQTAPGARPGDLVVALVGGLHPYILRAVTPPSPIADPLEADAKHIFVGECHLQGVMEGECFQVAKEDTGIQWREDVELTDITIV